MAADSARILRWRDGRLSPSAGAPGRLLVADSLLVSDGGAIALDRHRDRFLASVRDPAVAALAGRPLPRDGDRFWAAALADLPRRGAWFPRLELADTDEGLEFRLRLRPAPPLGTSVSLATWTGRDPRRVPHVKGPDLEALLAVREEVLARGAGEAVLLSPDGLVCDGSTSAIAWWEEETLCVPPSRLARVASVTLAAVVGIARAAGVRATFRARRPEDLAGREVWALNALQGIRRADAWIGGPPLAASEGRLEEWGSRLESLRRPVAGS